MSDIKKKDINEKYYFDNVNKVKGFALPWPVYFLKDEKNLTAQFLDIGSMLLPQKMFT